MAYFDRTKVNKILIIKPAAIGDVLLATPVIENSRNNFPEAEIYFLTQKHCVEVLTGNPFLTKAVTYDLKYDTTAFLIKHIGRQKYDLLIDLYGNPRTAIVTYFSSARYRVGYKFNWRRFAYNIKVNPRRTQIHNIEFNLDSLRKLGLKVTSTKPKFVLNSVHREFAGRFFAANGLENISVAGLNPSGTWKTKVWDKFAELGKMLAQNSKILIFWGTATEKLDAEKIRGEIGENAVLIPEADLKYMGALMQKCNVFITNDTGPMHIAWTLGVNTVAIFGPTNPVMQGPLSNNSTVVRNETLTCLGCNLTRIEDCPNEHRCMKELSAAEVYNCALAYIEKEPVN